MSSDSGRASAGASISWSPFTSPNSTEKSTEPPSIPLSVERLSSGTSKSICPDTLRITWSCLPTQTSKVGSFTTSESFWMSSLLSVLGAACPVAPVSAAPERCMNSLMLAMSLATSSRPDTWLVSTPATRSSPSSEASESQLRGSSPSARSEVPRPPALRMEALAART